AGTQICARTRELKFVREGENPNLYAKARTPPRTFRTPFTGFRRIFVLTRNRQVVSGKRFYAKTQRPSRSMSDGIDALAFAASLFLRRLATFSSSKDV
ncbi:MAG: hypothetical protein V3V20_02470, partial [Algisphaera sp.]